MAHRLISSLAHVELLTPDLEASAQFAVDALGLHVVEEAADSVYLRAWGDWYRYSIVLTKSDAPGIGHASWRTEGPEELELAVARLESNGTPGRWVEDSFAHGPAYRFESPGGHQFELVWDVEKAVAPAGEESPYPERPQRASRHGVGVRMLDHVTVTNPDVRETAEWSRDALGFRIMAATEPAPGDPWVFSIVTTNEKAHDLGLLRDFQNERGRLHHLAFWVETNQELTEGAKFLIEGGWDVDFGPGQHGMGEQHYLYFRDPTGLRYELNAGGYRNYVPDWETVIWRAEDGPNNTYRTELEMPPVHLASIPPGVAGRPQPQPSEEMVESGLAALANS